MIYFLTGNQHKLREARQIFGEDIEQLILDIELPEIQSLDSMEVLDHKIKSAIRYLQSHTEYDPEIKFFVEDVSLHCTALNGFPGPLVKWCITSMGSQGLYDILSSFEDKSAKAVCSIGYRDGRQIHFVMGEIQDQIVTKQGETSFGWDSVFLPDGYDQTFAQMDPINKNLISHRRIALDALNSKIISTSV